MTRDAQTSSSSSSLKPLPEARRAPSGEIDPELLSLPDPPKTGRTLTLAILAVTALASLAMVFALRRDVAYALAPSSPTDLGDLRTAEQTAIRSLENLPVTAHGMLGAAGGIRFERPFTLDSFRAMPVAGRPSIWVEVRVPRGQENGRWEPPRTFSGRLLRFQATGPRHRGLASAIEAATGGAISKDAFLLVDGEVPQASRWPLALAALFFAFGVWNLGAIVRIVRKVA